MGSPNVLTSGGCATLKESGEAPKYFVLMTGFDSYGIHKKISGALPLGIITDITPALKHWATHIESVPDSVVTKPFVITNLFPVAEKNAPYAI
jgi:hypothetical protein